MNTFGWPKVLFPLVLIGALTLSSHAVAQKAGEPVIFARGTELAANQVLEIPQQCDKDAVAVLCDRGASADSTEEDSQPQDELPATAGGQVYGSIEDYENQREADATVVYLAPRPVYVPAYPLYRTMPAPGGVPAAPAGPRFLAPLPYRPGAFGGGFGRR